MVLSKVDVANNVDCILPLAAVADKMLAAVAEQCSKAAVAFAVTDHSFDMREDMLDSDATVRSGPVREAH